MAARIVFNPFVLSLVGLGVFGAIAYGMGPDSGAAGALALSVLAALMPAAAIFARNWWLYAIQMAVAGPLAFVAAMLLLEFVGAAEKMGPAGMVYLFPMLIFIGGTLASGAVRLILQLIRRAGGGHQDEPFLSRPVKIGLGIAAALLVGWCGLAVGTSFWEARQDEVGRAHAAALPADSLAALTGTTASAGGTAYVQIMNSTSFTLTGATIEAKRAGAEWPGERIAREFGISARPGDWFYVDVALADAEANEIEWRVVEAKGYR